MIVIVNICISDNFRQGFCWLRLLVVGQTRLAGNVEFFGTYELTSIVNTHFKF